MTVKTWRNGSPVAGVRFDPAHRSLLQGDGLYETIRVRKGVPLYLNRHLDRLVLSAQRCGYPWIGSGEYLDGPLNEPLRSAQIMRSAVMRIYAFPSARDGSPEIYVTLGDFDPPAESEYWRGFRMKVSSVPHPMLGRYGKTVSRHWARTSRRLSQQAGYDDGILLSDGLCVETSDATLLWSRGGYWYSAPQHAGGLESTTLAEMESRGLLVDQELVDPDTLKQSEAVVLLSSLRVAMGVKSIDDVEYENPDVNAMMLRALILD